MCVYLCEMKCLTNDRRHLARRGELQFISTGADCFIMLSCLEKKTMRAFSVWHYLKWVLPCVKGYVGMCVRVCVWVFPHFDLSCEFYPTELQHSGPVIHLFHGPHAIVIALVQCWFFIRHLFPKSPGSSSFIRPSLERQYKASCCHVESPCRQNFIPEWANDKWAALKPLRAFGKE